jgi:AraC-like DNA-binding protein
MSPEASSTRDSALARFTVRSDNFRERVLPVAQRQERVSIIYLSLWNAWIESHIESPDELTVARLAQVAGLSPSRFQAAFKQETGIPPAEFALSARITEASRRLARPGADVTSVAFSLGFSSSQYFASAFRRFTNISPREALRKGPG